MQMRGFRDPSTRIAVLGCQRSGNCLLPPDGIPDHRARTSLANRAGPIHVFFRVQSPDFGAR